MDFEGFLRWEFSSRDTIDFKRVYVDMAGSVNAGLMLSEIVYWHLPSKEGNERLQVERDGYKWIACRRYEWWDRTRLSPKESDTALTTLINKGLVIKALYKFQGEVTIHVRLDQKVFLSQLDYAVSHPVENPFSPKGKIQITQKVKSKSPKTENPYTENTSKTLTRKESVSSSDETLSPTRKVLEASHVINPAAPRVITLDILATNNPLTVDEELQSNGFTDKPQSPAVRAALDKKARDEQVKREKIAAMKAEEQRWQDDLPAMGQAVLDVFGIGGAPGGLYVGMLRGKGKRGEWKDYQITGGQVWAVDLRTWAAWWKSNNPGAHMVKEPDKVSGSIEAWLALGKPKAGQKTANGNQAQTAPNKKLLDFMRSE